MDSPQILNSVDRTTGSEDATGRRMASIVRRIAFVAVLASGAFVDLRMHTNAASDLQPPALPGPTAVSDDQQLPIPVYGREPDFRFDM